MSESGTALSTSEQASGALPDINAITRELRESLASTFDDWREGWFSSIFMGTEQVLEVNGEAEREGVDENKVVSSAVAPCEETRKIKIAHFHENVSKTPIPFTSFQIQEKTGWLFRSWGTVHSGTTDENGLADVPVTPGKEYRVVMSPDVTRADMDALYETYEGFIDRCCALLENTWQSGAREEWDRYLSMSSVEQSLATYGRFQQGISDGFIGVLDDIRRIYDVICGLLDHDFSNLPEDIRDQLETLKKADEAYLKACLVANDEIFLFLVMYTVRQYFRLLAPTQVAEVSGELVGQILFDVVVGLIITGGAGLAAKYGARIGSKAAASAMDVADSARTSKNILGEFLGQFAREFQDFMESIGTNHRAIQVAGGSRLDASGTQRGADVRNRNQVYSQIADDDQVTNLQSSGRNHAATSESSNPPPRDERSPSETDQGRTTQDNSSTEKVSDPISTVTGEEVLELTDARLPGALLFEFKRVYRSGSSDRRFDMGYGWRHSLNHSLSFEADGIIWHDHEGKNTRLPELDSAPFGTNSQSGMAAWKDGELIVTCAGEKAPRYHFRREGDLGVLVEISDRYGNQLRVGYDLHGQLERIVSDSGHALEFGFEHKRLKTVSLLHRKLTDTGYQWQTLREERHYQYDENDNLVAVEDPVGGIERYGYNNHMLISRQLAGGYSFYLEWDKTEPQGRCIHQWGDSAQVDTRFEWDDENHSCTVRYVDGSKEIWRYDGSAQLQEKIDPDGAKHVSEYDDNGQLLATVDPMGARTEYQYDKNGRLQGKVGPDGQPILFTYRKGRIAEIHRGGQVWKFDYTSQGDLLAETDPKGRITRYRYNPQGQLVQVNLPDGRTHKWGWNGHGQLIEETTPTGAFYQYRYDEFGQLLAKKDARGAITRYQYDGLGRVTDEILSGNRRRQYHYNHYNKVTRFVDEQGRETRYEYGNNLHLLTRRINPDGSELRYRYDHHRFLLTHIENERGEEYRIDYYPNGLVKQETAFDGRRTAYQYDLNGHLIEKAEYGTTSDVLQTTAYERDELGQLLKKVLPDGRDIQYGYNADGKLIGVDDGSWPLVFEYDEYGLLTTEHQGWATLRYRYDDMDRLSGMVLPDGQTLSYEHDKAGLLSGIDLNGQRLTRHRMAATGEEMERQQGDLLSAYVYDEEGRLTQHRIHQGQIKDIAAQRDYQYDPSGNLKTIQDSRKGLREYVYDPMDRLVGVRGDIYEQLIHDPAGNLLEQGQGASTDNRTNVRGNRLTMHGDCHYEYDEFGNLTEERRGKDQKLVTRYSYDCQHRLTSVTKPDGSTWHYEYDAFGRRIAKTSGLTKTEFLWQGDRLIAEETGDQYRTFVYESDSFKPLALVDGYGTEQASIYYYHLDHLGTPQEITNARGDLVWSVTYRAYGNVVRALVNDIDNPIRFQGQYHDPETGLHYNRHRYYNPNTGRFLTPDPIGLAGGLNNYQYVPNPTGWVDPLGLTSISKDSPDREGGSNTWNDFQRDHKGQFSDSTSASNAYRELLEKQSPWPIGFEPSEATLLPGARFQMAMSPTQPSVRPGGFGTFDSIPTVDYVRNDLAVKEAWKPDVDRIVTYEVVNPMPVKVGPVGPQVDEASRRYLQGGGTQLQITVPPTDRMSYLRVVDESPIE
ncbi:MAG: Rhs family protein [Marinobacter excellens HL-55]|uniref:Rhs family protein n=1 Tax=Marinobacter excellens HL-55 TaxID=1305731 RepID=A0A0P7Z8V9_9GAMM|nr:MAG: Rhs family protein [Marinobacter excellens HL-55]